MGKWKKIRTLLYMWTWDKHVKAKLTCLFSNNELNRRKKNISANSVSEYSTFRKILHFLLTSGSRNLQYVSTVYDLYLLNFIQDIKVIHNIQDKLLNPVVTTDVVTKSYTKPWLRRLPRTPRALAVSPWTARDHTPCSLPLLPPWILLPDHILVRCTPYPHCHYPAALPPITLVTALHKHRHLNPVSAV